jgi:hypothetical protein
MYIFTETTNFNSNKNTNASNNERQQVPTVRSYSVLGDGTCNYKRKDKAILVTDRGDV